jgi:hypothetical protein
MSEMILNDPLASEIRRVAETEGVPAEELIEIALRQYRFQAQRKKIDAEITWWRSQPSSVRARYRSEFVAVHQQSVVDHDRDEDVLRQRVRSKYGKTAILFAPAEGERDFKIVSTRLARS